jgi:hypothetical protein
MGRKPASLVECNDCGEIIADGDISAKDIIALCQKTLGQGVKRAFCANCLAERLDLSVEDFPELVKRFKEQGCTLF